MRVIQESCTHNVHTNLFYRCIYASTTFSILVPFCVQWFYCVGIIELGFTSYFGTHLRLSLCQLSRSTLLCFLDSLDPQLVTRWSAGCLNAVGRGGTSGSLSVGSIDNSSVDWLCGLGQYLQGPVLIALRLMLWAFFFFFFWRTIVSNSDDQSVMIIIFS